MPLQTIAFMWHTLWHIYNGISFHTFVYIVSTSIGRHCQRRMGVLRYKADNWIYGLRRQLNGTIKPTHKLLGFESVYIHHATKAPLSPAYEKQQLPYKIDGVKLSCMKKGMWHNVNGNGNPANNIHIYQIHKLDLQDISKCKNHLLA